jgi:H+/Cl- antiporter ClcA
MKHFCGLLRWLLMLLILAVGVGSGSAGFLWALDRVTLLRLENPWLLSLLPLGSLIVSGLYQRYGGTANLGNRLIFSQLREPSAAGVPLRIAPLVVFGTLVTHLCGGSAGREGTALQMASGFASSLGRVFKTDLKQQQMLLRAGVAAGFGSVFGTPIAGVIFAVEVVWKTRPNFAAILACAVAAFASDWICKAWGTAHTLFQISTPAAEGNSVFWLLLKVSVAAVAIGLVSKSYVRSVSLLTAFLNVAVPVPAIRALIGGVLVIGLYLLVATPDYLGLGVIGNRPGAITLPALFTANWVPPSAWIWKLVFTVITLSSGFKGGEVTPLFYIGAALGNTLALALGAPVDLFAAIGMLAIFGSAANTPLTALMIGLELFGVGHGYYFLIACLLAHRCSGKPGIYTSDAN